MELAGDLAGARPAAEQPLCLLADLYRYLRVFDRAMAGTARAYAERAVAAGDRPADAWLSWRRCRQGRRPRRRAAGGAARRRGTVATPRPCAGAAPRPGTRTSPSILAGPPGLRRGAGGPALREAPRAVDADRGAENAFLELMQDTVARDPGNVEARLRLLAWHHWQGRRTRPPGTSWRWRRCSATGAVTCRDGPHPRAICWARERPGAGRHPLCPPVVRDGAGRDPPAARSGSRARPGRRHRAVRRERRAPRASRHRGHAAPLAVRDHQPLGDVRLPRGREPDDHQLLSPFFRVISEVRGQNPVTQNVFGLAGRLTGRVLGVLFIVGTVTLRASSRSACTTGLCRRLPALAGAGHLLERGAVAAIVAYCLYAIVLIYNGGLDRSPGPAPRLRGPGQLRGRAAVRLPLAVVRGPALLARSGTIERVLIFPLVDDLVPGKSDPGSPSGSPSGPASWASPGSSGSSVTPTGTSPASWTTSPGWRSPAAASPSGWSPRAGGRKCSRRSTNTTGTTRMTASTSSRRRRRCAGPGRARELRAHPGADRPEHGRLEVPGAAARGGGDGERRHSPRCRRESLALAVEVVTLTGLDRVLGTSAARPTRGRAAGPGIPGPPSAAPPREPPTGARRSSRRQCGASPPDWGSPTPGRR